MKALLLILIFHPILATLLVVALATRLLTRTRLRSSRRPILVGTAIGLTVYFVVDSAFAYRRAAYAWQISGTPVIHRTIPSPPSLVLVGLACDRPCLDRLVDSTFENVTVIHNPYPPGPPLRYSVVRGAPNDCAIDLVRRAERAWDSATVKALRDRGICPMIEESDTPTEGIFVVHEGVAAAAAERAGEFSPQYIVAHPPTAVIQFLAIEVQRRSSTGTEVLAEARYYEAPGFLGFPPLIGCWQRPDNVIWIMPAGNTGCGFWRRIVSGGDARHASDASWVYSTVVMGGR
jgi:hypothetical protein